MAERRETGLPGACAQVGYEIRVQMLEIYNEALRDLLVDEAEARQQRPLELRDTQRSGANVPDAIQVRGRGRGRGPCTGPWGRPAGWVLGRAGGGHGWLHLAEAGSVLLAAGRSAPVGKGKWMALHVQHGGQHLKCAV